MCYEILGCGQVTGRDAIQRTYQFKDFNTAFAFMTRSALAAEVVRPFACRCDPSVFDLRCPRSAITTQNGSTCTTKWM